MPLDLSPVHGHNQHRNAGIARRAATFPAGTYQVGGCARLLLAGGMLNITATYSRIISATGRPPEEGGSKNPMVMVVVVVAVAVAVAKGWGKGYRRRKVRGPVRFGRSTV